VFVDEAIVHVQAGAGGDGRVAFLREAYRPMGGPAGGDGGRGGSVLFRASPHVGTLLEISRQPVYRARGGEPGGPKKMTGASADDFVVEVPMGTLVYTVPSESEPEPRLLCDLTGDGQLFCAAKGGKGGKGNARFASATNQTPLEHEPGQPGENRRLRLELKLLADVGLVGLPNAGKSTLISRVSAARPRIAAYPFTTLSPVPGIVDLGDYRSCVFADLPGLIEGAHKGVGLGVQFLRHIERTRMILHLIDAAPLDGRAPESAYAEIRAELDLYGHGLARKPEVVVLSKLDLPGADAALERVRAALPGREVLGISAVSGAGLKELLSSVRRHLDALAAAEAAEAATPKAAPTAAAPTG
jgi:GTP-binding protein